MGRWVTSKGRRVYIPDEGEKNPFDESADINLAFEKKAAAVKDAKEVWRIDREGFAVGVINSGDLFVGTGGLDNVFYKDTPENRKLAESYWQSNTFSKEIKKQRNRKGGK